MELAFYAGTNLNIKAKDTPNMSAVTTMYRAFESATNLTGNFT